MLGKVLYALGGVCLLAIPGAIALNFGLKAWYGGKPDPVASVAGNFFVREKHRLTPVSGEEYLRLQTVQRNENWYLKPCAFGAAALAVGRLIRPRMMTRKNEKAGLLRNGVRRSSVREEQRCVAAVGVEVVAVVAVVAQA